MEQTKPDADLVKRLGATDASAPFLEILESAPDGFVLIDAAGTIVMANARIVEMFGYSRPELIGKPVETLVPDAKREAHVQHRLGYFARPTKRPMGAQLTIRGLRKNGSEIPLDIAISYVETPEGLMGMGFIRERAD